MSQEKDAPDSEESEDVNFSIPENSSSLKMPKVQPPKQEAPKDQKKEPPRK